MPGMGGMPNFIPPGATNAASGGFGGSGGAGGGGMPDMAAVQNMLSDPTMMQNVMGMMNVSECISSYDVCFACRDHAYCIAKVNPFH